jgi:hypothetical protein
MSNRQRLFPSLAVIAIAAATCLAAAAPAAQMPAGELLELSIAYHDPDGLWESGSFRFRIAGTRPLAGPTFTGAIIDNESGRFHLERERMGRTIESTVTGDECWTRLDGSSEFTEQEAERFGLGCDAMKRMRDYHTYLYGLPMKLRDAGTRIDPEATRTAFEGRDVWQLRVTYDPEVGADTWYFYFDLETYALVGYRFYHDEAANDGEYIVLDREASGGGLRLPKVRAWYTHGDDRLLGTDTIQSIERLSRDR